VNIHVEQLHLQATGLPHTSPGQRPGFNVPFFLLQANGLLHKGLKEFVRLVSGQVDDESRLQRYQRYLGHDPRALPWAGMSDAFGVFSFAAASFRSAQRIPLRAHPVPILLRDSGCNDTIL
jgi:hypothetical protein